jgi:glycosyltransferase involved in cell wall biosynthesis
MKRYRVAIDARWAVRQINGISQYILQLASRIPALDSELSLTLLVDRAVASGHVPDGCEQAVLGSYLGDGTPSARFYSPFWLNFEVPRYLSLYRVDLFHGANFVLPRTSPCRTVATVHDMSFFREPRVYGPLYQFYMRRQVRATVGRADALITISHRTRDDITELQGARPEFIEVIHCGVDPRFRDQHPPSYLRRVKAAFELPARYILHVGAIEEKKNLAAVLSASAAALSADLADGVVFAGRDGLGAAGIRRLAAKLGLAGKARFLGYVPQDLLPGLYTLATLFVFPSHYEGFGLPVLEAMASGVPVIASSTSAIPEVAGDAAMLVDPADVNSLTQAVRAVLTDAQIRIQLRDRGLSRVRLFSWDEAAARHVAAYRRVLGIG